MGRTPQPAALPTALRRRTPRWEGALVDGKRLGPPNARVRIEVFHDFQCGPCAIGHLLLLHAVRTAKLQDVVAITHRDFPLDPSCNRRVQRMMHQQACASAYFAHCAAEQQRYWPFADRIFRLRGTTYPDLIEHAQKTGLDKKKLESCLARQDVRSAVVRDVEDGLRRRVMGTPTYWINGEKIVGPQPPAIWQAKIQALLGTATP